MIHCRTCNSVFVEFVLIKIYDKDLRTVDLCEFGDLGISVDLNDTL